MSMEDIRCCTFEQASPEKKREGFHWFVLRCLLRTCVCWCCVGVVVVVHCLSLEELRLFGGFCLKNLSITTLVNSRNWFPRESTPFRTLGDLCFLGSANEGRSTTTLLCWDGGRTPTCEGKDSNAHHAHAVRWYCGFNRWLDLIRVKWEGALYGNVV